MSSVFTTYDLLINALWSEFAKLTHLEVREEALILKNVHLLWLATHLPISVLPVPGGPNNSNPFGGPLRPVKMSLQQNRNLLSRPHKKDMYIIFSKVFERDSKLQLTYLKYKSASFSSKKVSRKGIASTKY